jgi:hypothetical protein
VLGFTLGAVFGNRKARLIPETTLVKYIGSGLLMASLAMAVSAVGHLR